MHKNRLTGFTLIELMIVVVVLAILGGIIYPSYRDYVVRTRRADAQIALSQAANAQEKFFSDCNYYAETLEGTSRICGTGSSDGVLAFADSAPVLSPERHYVITLVPPDANCLITSCYILQATPADSTDGTGLQVGDGPYRITSLGQKQWAKDGTNYNHKWTDK